MRAIPVHLRFWPKVDQSGGPNACWPFMGNRPDGRYGKIKADGKSRGAHQVAWELTNGPIPDALHVLHRCDNPPCCNPRHLFLGTSQANTLDAFEKGRRAVGEQHHKAKLSEGQVAHIRSLLVGGKLPYGVGRQLAAAYRVNEHTISRVVRGRFWRTLRSGGGEIDLSI